MSKTELNLVERARRVLKPVASDQALQELAGKYADVTAVKDKTDLEMAMGALRELRTTRTAIEKAGKDARADARAFADAVIAEERRLIGIIRPEEERIQSMRKAFEDEQARIKAEEEAREQARINGHKEQLRKIIELPARMAGKKSEAIEEAIGRLARIDPGDDWEEFRAEAIVERDRALKRMTEMLGEAIEEKQAESERRQREEEEAERRRQEAAELAKQRAEQERQAAELAKQQAEIERQRQEIEQQRLAAEEAERQRQAAIQQERRRQEAEELERQQAEERRQAEEQARQAAEEAERQRQAAEVETRTSTESEFLHELNAWAKRRKISNAALAELVDLLQHHGIMPHDQAA